MLSMPIFRRSTRIFACAQSASAMSVGVTEPKSEPVGPALTSKRSSVFATAPAAAPAALAIVRTLGDVREERHLTGPLHRGRDLHLMAPARTGDAAAADLALLRDVPPELVDVLVVDLGDLVLAEEAIP